jgi:hypothetical protein
MTEGHTERLETALDGKYLFETMGLHQARPSATNLDVHPAGDRFVFVRDAGAENALGNGTLVITNALTRNR